MKGKYPEYPVEQISDIREMFFRSCERFADKTALQYKKGDRWIPISYRELHDTVEQAACGLAALGLHPAESKLAILGENRPEWAVTYLAAACTGIVCVPIDKDLKETEVYHILYLSGAEAAVVDAKHIEMLRDIRKKLPVLATLVSMDEDTPGAESGVMGFGQLRALGRARIE
ncbi:MAG: AMP-binding protein, partial [Acidobacteriota bacterium]